MKRALIVALMLGMLQFGPTAYTQEARQRLGSSRLHRISLIRVIANPSEFDGENIFVAGYLAGAGPDNSPGIFVSESDGRNGILSNAIDITVGNSSIREMFGKYVIVVGLYHAPPPHGDFNGFIDHIVEVKPINGANATK